jgi:hypothetical protein
MLRQQPFHSPAPPACHRLPAGSVGPQGYVDAAQVFERESGTAPGVELDQITDRMDIRKAVQRGDVEQARGCLAGGPRLLAFTGGPAACTPSLL